MRIKTATLRAGTYTVKTLDALCQQGPMTAAQISRFLDDGGITRAEQSCQSLLAREFILIAGYSVTQSGHPCTVYAVTEAGRNVQIIPTIENQILEALKNSEILTSKQIHRRTRGAKIKSVRRICAYLVELGKIERCGSSSRVTTMRGGGGPASLYRIAGSNGIAPTEKPLSRREMIPGDSEQKSWLASVQAARAARIARFEACSAGRRG